jgi:hypothetical protein
MILTAYRHGLQDSGAVRTTVGSSGLLARFPAVRRIKNGTPSVHPMGGVEIRALRRLKREQAESRHVFLTERVAPMSTQQGLAIAGEKNMHGL